MPLAATAGVGATAQVLQATVAGQEEICLSQVLGAQATTTQVAADHMVLALTTLLAGRGATAAAERAARQEVFTAGAERAAREAEAGEAEAAAGLVLILVTQGAAVAEVAGAERAAQEDKGLSSYHMALP